MLKNKSFWLGLIISLLFLYLAFGNLNFPKLLLAFKQMNYWYIPAGIAIFLFGVLLRSMRWSYQLNELRVLNKTVHPFKITTFSVFPSLTIGYFANNIFPARAGELFRTYAWGKKFHMKASSVLATIIVDRLFDGFAMVTLAVITSFFLKIDDHMSFIIKFAAALFFIVLIVSFLMVSFPAPAEKFLDKIVRIIPNANISEKIKHMYHAFLDGFKVLPNIKSVIIIYGLSLLAWLCEALVFSTIALAFSIHLPFYAFIFTGAIASLWTLIPAGPGYAGTFDYATISALGLFSVNAELAGVYTVIMHLVLWLPITLIGAYFLWHEEISLKSVNSSK